MAALLLPYEPTGESVDDHVWTYKSTAQLGASLLSRLTEAADGHRDEEQTWLVAELKRQYGTGHKINGPYGTAQLAFDADRSLFDVVTPANDKYKIFGPFITGEDFGTKERRVASVTLHLTSGRDVCLDGAKYDCVFWSTSAVDKFVVPYYVHITNLQEAEHVRNHFMHHSAIAAIHIPGSEIIDGANPAATGDAGYGERPRAAGTTPGTGVCPDGLVPEDGDSIGMGMLEWVPGGGDRVRITPA